MNRRDKDLNIIEGIDCRIDPDLMYELSQLRDSEPAIRSRSLSTRDWLVKHKPAVLLTIAAGLFTSLGGFTIEQKVGEPKVHSKKEEHLRKAEGYKRCRDLVTQRGDVPFYEELTVRVTTLLPNQLKDCGVNVDNAELARARNDAISRANGEAGSSIRDRILSLPSEGSLIDKESTEKYDATHDPYLEYRNIRVGWAIGGAALFGSLWGMATTLDRRRNHKKPMGV